MFKNDELKEFVPIKKHKFKLKGLVLYITLFVLMLTLGVSYSFFIYNSDGKSHELIAGNIYLNSTDNGNVSLLDLYPMTDSDGMKKGIKYRFNVSGYNLSNKTIYYGIYINEGEDIASKTRLRTNDIKFSLTETINGVTKTVVGPMSVDNFNRKLLYTNTVAGNISKEDEITVDYELTVWIDEKVLISDSITNSEGRSIYTTEEFKNSYASVKIEVYGDFIEKATQY